MDEQQLLGSTISSMVLPTLGSDVAELLQTMQPEPNVDSAIQRAVDSLVAEVALFAKRIMECLDAWVASLPEELQAYILNSGKPMVDAAVDYERDLKRQRSKQAVENQRRIARGGKWKAF